jgi:hypothetical protein
MLESLSMLFVNESVSSNYDRVGLLRDLDLKCSIRTLISMFDIDEQLSNMVVDHRHRHWDQLAIAEAALLALTNQN